MTVAVEKSIKERPILMSGSMVRAILEGRKTQTRRVIKSQPTYITHAGVWAWDEEKKGCEILFERELDVIPRKLIEVCPYGKPGDRLWVRETWNTWGPPERIFGVDYAATNPERDDLKWKPSIFMPRWASRITLEITDVRVEQVQSISEADAIAEGIEPLYSQEAIRTTVGLESYRFGQPVPWTNYLWHGHPGGSEGYSSAENAVDSYRSLWDSINGKKFPWTSNPFVFVVEFKRVD